MHICSDTMIQIPLQVSFLNITGFRAFPLGDLPMLEVCLSFITIKYFHYLPLSGEVTGLYNW